MKPNELRAKSIEELRQELLSLCKEQFNLNTQKGVGQPPKPHLRYAVRKNIARVKTILREKGQQV